MAKLSKEEVEEIIERDLPDYKVVKESLEKNLSNGAGSVLHRDSPKGSASDAASPDLNTLREKLKSRPASRGARSLADHTADDVDDNAADDMIVAVRPKRSGNPFDSGYRTKAVVISGRSKKVIGRQG